MSYKPLSDYKFRHGGTIHEQFAKISVARLRSIATSVGKFKASLMKSREGIYSSIEQAELAIQEAICNSASPEIDDSGRSTSGNARPLIDFTFSQGGSIHEKFSAYTVDSLRKVVTRIGHVQWSATKNRGAIYECIERVSPDVQHAIVEEMSKEFQSARTKYAAYNRQTPNKRSSPGPEDDIPNQARKKRKLNNATSRIGSSSSAGPSTIFPSAVISDPLIQATSSVASTQIAEMDIDIPTVIDSNEDHRIEQLLESDFMRAPSADAIAKSMAKFIDATNNAAVSMCACACCAREWNCENVHRFKISDIPYRDHLRPSKPHPKHDIFDGILLYPDAIELSDIAVICNECYTRLKHNQLPKYALANGTWIGKTPPELSDLSLPERMLIAKYFPAAYIVKLFPKSKETGGWKRSQLHNGLRGNVSTYILDPKQVATMVEGPKMPPPSTILSATIGITFIGPSGLTERTMPAMFRVRRERIRKALIWLKANNWIYSDIEISETRLQALPVNGIPEELIRTAKYSPDVDAVYAEHDSYVPDQVDSEAEDEIRNQQAIEDAGLIELSDDEDFDTEIPPMIMPLNALGVVDVEGVAITDQELMAHAFANTAQQNPPEDFLIRRGSAFVNEYARTNEDGQRNDGGPSNPNHLLGSFPTLFPYGMGGFEVERTIDIPYEAHVRWALAYADRRFRLDFHFPFQVFGVCQKRQVCRSAVLQIKKPAFNQHINAISRLTAADFLEASKEETRGVPFSNPGIRALRKQLSAIRTRVVGTDESRAAIRSKIWGMNLAYNPPSLWITINPADTQDPIAQVLAGIDIDLDNFCNTAGPDNEQRAINIASDPYASAKFFHFTIETVLDCLFGIRKKREGTSDPDVGILGRVQGYIGTVEAQGRGTLHLHMLLWLKDAPSSKFMENALKSEQFRQRIKDYIKVVVHADIDELSLENVRRLIPKEAAISYSRPLDPRTKDTNEINANERKLARALQLHKCSLSSCLKIINGRLRCKRRAPFKTAPEEWVETNGEWGPKRFCGFFNNWNPSLLQAIRSNHDIKLILNGGMTKSVTWYITNYATKKQQRSSNITAIIAKKYAFHKRAVKRESDIKKANKQLIQRCANALSTSHEFSAPEIMSYLMGWGDRYESHIFAPIYWDSAMGALKRAYPELTHSNHSFSNVLREAGTDMDVDYTSSNSNSVALNSEVDVTITIVANEVHLKDQLKDYQYRGDALEDMSLFEFVVETYERTKTSESAATIDDDDNDENDIEIRPSRGRKRSLRVPYRDAAGKPKMCRVVRAEGHDTVPRIVGKWLPRSDDESVRELYCASMALLLKPWRSLGELKQADETFEGNWTSYMEGLSDRKRRVVENIQYFHECADSAREQRLAEAETEESAEGLEYEYEADEEEELENELENIYAVQLTEEDVEKARRDKIPMRDQLFAEHGVQIATDLNFFPDDDEEETVYEPVAKNAEKDDMPVIQKWAKQLQETTRRQFSENGLVDIASTSASVDAGIIPSSESNQETDSANDEEHSIQDIPPSIEEVIALNREPQRPKWSLLNRDQRRAHDIIERTLLAELAGEYPDQLKMQIQGQGGTGKSLLIAAITETFQYHRVPNLLAKCATSGIAASEIKAQTLHSWAGLSIRQPKGEDWFNKASKAVQGARIRNIAGKLFLVIDEISMADKASLYLVSQIIGLVKAAEGKARPGSFAGIHVIITGDFHQFPPVANILGALFELKHPNSKDIQRSQLGRQIYEGFETVVILKEQVRVRDDIWMNILSRLRVGECTDEDIAEIRKLVLTNPECDVPDFTSSPWKDAILVTSRHSVRERWNSESLKKHCRNTGQVRYIVHAEDTLKPKDGPVPLNVRVKAAALPEKGNSRLREIVEIAVGMKAMVLLNLSTEADIANGTRGTITDIKLDPREPPVKPDDQGVVRLQYPPAMILFKPDCGTDIVFEGLPSGVVPITPSMCSFSVQIGKKVHQIRRRQLAITAGYAFTDYKSQGQTIEFVIIDIGKPPAGSLSPFSTYVALSRSRGRDTIRLLRDFDDRLFTNHPSESLRVEMKRLEELDRMTEHKFNNLARD